MFYLFLYLQRQIKIQKERLTNDLVKTLNKFHEVQKHAMQKQRESNERARANMQHGGDQEGIKLHPMRSNNNIIDFGDDELGSFENNSSAGTRSNNAFQNFPPGQTQQQQQQQQAQIAMEADVNMVQLREREAALNKLENDIVDVNMIFKDLAVMVHDQGEIIDSIESNVEAVQMRVTSANSHLESAKNNQV